MRLSTMLLPFIILIIVAPAFAAESGCSEVAATSAGIQEQIAAIQERLAALQQRLEELEAQAAAAEEEAEEGELADLRAAAEEDAAGEAVTEEEEPEATFTSGALGLQALNSEISVTGDFISSYRSGNEVDSPFENNFRNLGLHLESYLDPYSRFKSAVEVHTDGVELGEDLGPVVVQARDLPDVNRSRMHEDGIDAGVGELPTVGHEFLGHPAVDAADFNMRTFGGRHRLLRPCRKTPRRGRRPAVLRDERIGSCREWSTTPHSERWGARPHSERWGACPTA